MHSATRKDVVAKPEVSDPPQMLLFSSENHQSTAHTKTPTKQSWSKLLARVFKIDVTICPKCSGQMKITDAVTKNETIRTVLAGASQAQPRDGPLCAQLLMNLCSERVCQKNSACRVTHRSVQSHQIPIENTLPASLLRFASDNFNTCRTK